MSPSIRFLQITLLVAVATSASGAEAPVATPLLDDDAIKQRVYATVTPNDEFGFTRKGPSKKGDWLFTYHEHPQRFEEYAVTPHVRPTANRRTIVLQPLGDMSDEKKQMLEYLRDYAEAFFQLPTRIEEPLALPTPDSNKELSRPVPMGLRRNGYERQFNADRILDSILLKRVPKDAVVYLGITMEDLYSGDLHYVFGLGDVQNRVGVYSLCRYFPEFWTQKRLPDASVTALRRACKVLNHETGHMFGLLHCVFYNCSMNGSMSLPETDAAPVHFCPICQKKLLWNIVCDPEKQLDSIRDFYAKHEMKEESTFIEARLSQLRKNTEIEKRRNAGDE